MNTSPQEIHRPARYVASALSALLMAVGHAGQAAPSTEQVGRVIASAGGFTAETADGQNRSLRRRSPIFVGDVLVTSKKGKAQVRFTDGGLVALKPDTRFRVDEYRYSGEDEPAQNAAFSLLKGGMRTITGVIGKDDPDGYKVTTPVATIGVRGTHYGLQLCQGDCFQETGKPLPDGMYGGVAEGQIVAQNNAGQADFGRDEYFHIADVDTRPKSLLAPPGVVFNPEDADSEAEEEEEGADASSEEGDSQESSDDADASPEGDEKGVESETQPDGEEQAAAQPPQDAQDAAAGTEAQEDAARPDSDNAIGEAAAPATSEELTNGDTLTETHSSDDPVGELVGADGDIGPSSEGTEGAVELTPTVAAGEQIDEEGSLEIIPEEVSPLAEGERFAPEGSILAFAHLLQLEDPADPGPQPLIVPVGTFDHGTTRVVLNDDEEVVAIDLLPDSESEPIEIEGFSFRGEGIPVESGRVESLGVSFGRWREYETRLGTQPEPNVGDLHYLYTENHSIPEDVRSFLGTDTARIGLIEFDLVAGTQPTDENGAVGTLDLFKFQVNFFTSLVTDAKLEATVGSRSFQLDSATDPTWVGQLFEDVGGFHFHIPGSCVGCTTSDATALVDGGFLGPEPDGAFATYIIREGVSSIRDLVIGTAVFERGAGDVGTVMDAPPGSGLIMASMFADPPDPDFPGPFEPETGALLPEGNNRIVLGTIDGVGNVPVAFAVFDEPLDPSAPADPMDPMDPIGPDPITVVPCDPCAFGSDHAVLHDTGGDTLGVNWGRWDGEYNLIENGVPEPTFGHLHYIYSDRLTDPQTLPALSGLGSVMFNYVGGPAPTDELGRLGTVNAGQFGVDFTTQAFTSADFDISVGARNYAASLDPVGPRDFSSVLGADRGGLLLNGTCTGGACGAGAPIIGDASPAFVGPNAEGLLGGFALRQNDTGTGVTGVGLFKR